MLAAAMTILGCRSVHAGAFTLPSGDGILFATTLFSRSAQNFDSKGFPSLSAKTIKREFSLYGEYGVTDWLTAVGQTTLASRSVGGLQPDNFSGFDYTAIGARARFFRSEHFVASIEGNLRIPGASDNLRPAEIGHTGVETDLRLQGGASFALWSWQSFADTSLGYRFRNGDPPSEYRADFTFGTRPLARWLWLLQSFNTISNGRGQNGFPAQREHKIQASIVYDIDKAWSVQLGTVATVAGKNMTRDLGGFAGVWRRF